jgi:hypothetical protein
MRKRRLGRRIEIDCDEDSLEPLTRRIHDRSS